MCSFIFGNTTFIPRTAATKVYLAFVFCFQFCCCCCCCCFFFLPERIKVLQPCLPRHTGPTQSSLSLFFFRVREDENMLHTSLATQAFRHTGLITTQDYFLTGLFCHRLNLFVTWDHCMHFLPHRSLSLARSKYCTPHLPQRTIFHTGLLHALRSNRS